MVWKSLVLIFKNFEIWKDVPILQNYNYTPWVYIRSGYVDVWLLLKVGYIEQIIYLKQFTFNIYQVWLNWNLAIYDEQISCPP